MTFEEAIKYLIAPIATSTEPSAEYLKQKKAYELAIKALEYRAEVEKYGSELGMMLAHEKLYKERQAKLDAEWEDCKRKYPSLGGQE